MDLFKLLPCRFLATQASKPSGLFGRYFMAALFRKGNNAINQLVLHSLSLQPNDHVLEIGYGPGVLIRQITEDTPHAKTMGIDYSEAMHKQARQANQDYISQNRLQLDYGDCTILPYPDAAFDKVCCVNVIYFWQQPSVNLAEIHRVLKPGGMLVIGFRNKAQMESLNLDRTIFTCYSENELLDLLAGNGFCHSDIQHQSTYPPRFFLCDYLQGRRP
jgi:ubiquinone/menaquinone biosynthesis C-methylase UbiE